MRMLKLRGSSEHLYNAHVHTTHLRSVKSPSVAVSFETSAVASTSASTSDSVAAQFVPKTLRLRAIHALISGAKQVAQQVNLRSRAATPIERTPGDLCAQIHSSLLSGCTLREALFQALGQHPPAHCISQTWLQEAIRSYCCGTQSEEEYRDCAAHLLMLLDLCENSGVPAAAGLEALERSENLEQRSREKLKQAQALPQATIKLFLILPFAVLLTTGGIGANPLLFYLSLPGLICALIGTGLMVLGRAWMRKVVADFFQPTAIALPDRVHGGNRKTRRWKALMRPAKSLDMTRLTDAALLAEFIRLCLQAGLPLPAAFSVVGHTARAQPLRELGLFLQRGCPWKMAWNAACCFVTEESMMRRFQQTSEGAWIRGEPCVHRFARLSRAVEQKVKEQIDLNSVNLSLHLLLPIGLCFLPAFIVLVIIPTIAAFAGVL